MVDKECHADAGKHKCNGANERVDKNEDDGIGDNGEGAGDKIKEVIWDTLISGDILKGGVNDFGMADVFSEILIKSDGFV